MTDHNYEYRRFEGGLTEARVEFLTRALKDGLQYVEGFDGPSPANVLFRRMHHAAAADELFVAVYCNGNYVGQVTLPSEIYESYPERVDVTVAIGGWGRIHETRTFGIKKS